MTYLRRATMGRNATIVGGAQTRGVTPATGPPSGEFPPTQLPDQSTPQTAPPAVQPISITTAQQLVFHGDTPPDNPTPGWIWTNSQGQMFVYIDPGLWSAIGTNW